ncbi:MAG: hypothetical protein AB7S48_06700 [Bacteroidales bacterium]
MRKLSTLIIVALVLLNLLVLYRYKKLSHAYSSCNYSLAGQAKMSESIVNSLQESLHWQYRVAKKAFSGNPSTLDSLRLAIGNGTKLVLCFGDQTCEACVDNALADIKGLAGRVGARNMLFLTYFADKRDALVLSRRFADSIAVFNVVNESTLVLDQYHTAMPVNFFLMSRLLKPSHFYIHNTKFPKLNAVYYSSVSSYLQL